MILNLTGQKYSQNMEIPVYQSQKKDISVIMNADFLLTLEGRECIIDLSGVGPDMMAMLRENQFSILSLAQEEDGGSILLKILNLLKIHFDSRPHDFAATDRDGSRNIQLTIPGIIFSDVKGQNILATGLPIPPEIIHLLAQKGYKILRLRPL